MKVPNRKVVKLGLDQHDLNRFVQAHEAEGTRTLAATLVFLLDFYEGHKDRHQGRVRRWEPCGGKPL